MNRLLAAVWEAHGFLMAHRIPYALIGGLAVQQWGEPRLTVDADLTVMVPSDVETFARLVLGQFESRIPEPIPFARRARLLMIRASNGEPIDIAIGIEGYEEEVMRRVVSYEIEPGKTIRLCSAEDLVIYKAVAGRAKDLLDLSGILLKSGARLDVRYIRYWLGEFSNFLADSEILERFEDAWRTTRRSKERPFPKTTRRPRQKK